MSRANKKALRAQRHQSQVKQSVQGGGQRANMSEGIEKSKKGLKKSIFFGGVKYFMDLVKEK